MRIYVTCNIIVTNIKNPVMFVVRACGINYNGTFVTACTIWYGSVVCLGVRDRTRRRGLGILADHRDLQSLPGDQANRKIRLVSTDGVRLTDDNRVHELEKPIQQDLHLTSEFLPIEFDCPQDRLFSLG